MSGRVTTEIDTICTGCGLFHTTAERERVARRRMEMEPAELFEAYPCLFGTRTTAGRTLHRIRDTRANAK
jgi:hypothetical protein